MPRRPKKILECRDYVFSPDFPVVVLTGDVWRISDVRSDVLHFHNHVEIGICHSDSGVLEFQDASFGFRAGDVTLISGGIPHTTYSSPGAASLWSYIYVDFAQIINPLTSMGELPTGQLYRNLLHNSRLIINREQEPALSLLAHEIVNEVQERRPNYRHCVRSLLDALMDKLSRYADTAPAAEATGKPFPIAPALSYIDEHYMDSFRIDDLAAHCKMSTSYFRRIFTETMGLAPLEYLNRTRITRACTLLQRTDFSILEVCEAVGFSSLSSFNRHFSAIMGQPPTSWRRQVRADQPLELRSYAGWLVPPKESR